jgi:hypothetical protein
MTNVQIAYANEFSKYLYHPEIKDYLSKTIDETSKISQEQNELDAIISRYKIILTYNQKNRLRKLYSKRRRLLKLYTKNKEFMNEYAINSKNYFYIIICILFGYSRRFNDYCQRNHSHLKRSIDDIDNYKFLMFFTKEFLVIKESIINIFRNIILNNPIYQRELHLLNIDEYNSLSRLLQIFLYSLGFNTSLTEEFSQKEHILEIQIIAILEAYNRYCGDNSTCLLDIHKLIDRRERPIYESLKIE